MPNRRLTTKQFAFKEGILAGKSGVSAARDAGYKGNNDTLKAIACENLTKPYINNAITKARNDIKELNKETVRANFEEDRELCKTANDRTGMIRVDENFAKHVGFFELDHQQQGEQRALDAAQAAMAEVMAPLLIEKMMAKHVDSTVIEDSDVQGQRQAESSQ